MGIPTKPLAVVTGASSGIGLELAILFARLDYELVVAADDPAIDDAATRLRNLATAVTAVRVDLSRPDGVERLVEAIVAQNRPVAALVVNAGTGTAGDFTRDTTLADELTVVDLNVRSAVHLTRRVLPGMVAHGAGRVLVTSSIAAWSPGPYQAVYNASKAFLLSFSHALRAELVDTGVTVTALLPGPTATEFFRRAGMTGTAVADGPKDDAAAVARDGFRAMMAGRPQVVAGSWRNRVLVAVARILPERIKAVLHRRVSRPGSGK